MLTDTRDFGKYKESESRVTDRFVLKVSLLHLSLNIVLDPFIIHVSSQHGEPRCFATVAKCSSHFTLRQIEMLNSINCSFLLNFVSCIKLFFLQF